MYTYTSSYDQEVFIPKGQVMGGLAIGIIIFGEGGVPLVPGNVGNATTFSFPVYYKAIEATINKVDCDAVVVATPINLSRIIDIRKPNTRVYYELQEIGMPNLGEIVSRFGKEYNLPMR